jgi:hypothetical protein
MNQFHGSFIIEDKLISSFGESAIFSTSPCLTFSHIAKIVSSASEGEDESDIEEKIRKLKFEVVLQQIIVTGNKKKILELENKLQEYKLGHSVYLSLVGLGDPFVNIETNK